MTTHTALLVLALAAAAAAAPYGATTQRCSTECPLAAAKLSFIPGKTYSYTYTGKSKVQLKGVDGGLVETQWEKQVLLTVLGPCDVAISFKGSKVDGETGVPGIDRLEKYPLVVAMTDGRVQRVCSHPEDDIWAVNMKKGVASAMQISLPSLSPTNSGLNFTETDVVGTCPTHYQVEAEGAKVVVRKEKNHRLCQENYPTPDETPLPYLMGPLPIQESRSVCKQEIEHGIISSVVCEDKKVARPAYGVYKYVEAVQESTLRLTSSDASAPDTISHITQGRLVEKSLRYDYEPLKKDPTLMPQLEQTLQHICEITKDGAEADAAMELRKAVHLMRRIPLEGFKEIYTKVQSKQICPEHHKLYSLYMDAIAFVHEPEAVPVIVKELVEGRATGTRTALYSAALYLVPRPNLTAIQELEPLFRAKDLFSAKLAAASMVNTYCRHNPHCYDESPVRNLPQVIKQKIEQDLSSSSNEESQKEALSALKSLGNMGVITPEAADVVLRYMKKEDKKVNIRVAAAQAFRLAKCERPVTQQLVQYALRPGQNTEVRIASYLAAIPCVNHEDLQAIVTKISYNENTQVRGFILSHLLNLQQSDAPDKQRLRYLLTDILIPEDFEADWRKYSRNLDLSYYSPSLGLGAELESNLIYAPGSFIPRSLGVNLTAALDGTGIPFNIGEIGGRLEGLEPIIAQLLGPASYLKTSSYSKIFHDLVSFIQQKWNIIKHELESTLRERRSIDYAALESIISKLYGSQSGPLQADFFARFLGQEINYASLSERLQDINTDHLLQALIRYLMENLSTVKNVNLHSARALQVGLDYSFPTIQGTPFKINMEAMAVVGIEMETNLSGILSGQGASGSSLKILPSLSVETHGFVGYDAYIIKSGLKMNTTVSSRNGVAIKVSGQSGQDLQIDVEIPNKMEIIHVQSETFLMKHKLGQPDTKIVPPSMQDPRIRLNSCLTAFESVFGLKMCYYIDVPDIFRANSLPLGSPAIVTLSLNKTESAIKGYKIAVTTTPQGQATKYGLKVSVNGSSSPKEADMEITLKKDSQTSAAEVKLQSPSTQGEAKVSLVNRPEYKSLESAIIFKTSSIELSEAIKVEVKISTSGSGKKYEMNVYRSPSGRITPESKIFTGELVLTYTTPWIVVDISAKTQNALMQYIPFSVEVGGDLKYYYGIPIPMRLRKLELTIGFEDWKVTSFFRKTGGSSGSSEYLAVLRVVHGELILIDIQADLKLEGTLGVNFKELFFVKVKVGEAEYRIEQIMEYQATRMMFISQVTRPTENLKLIDIILEKTPQEIKFISLVQEPEYIPPIQVAVGAVQQGEAYNTEAILMLGQVKLVELHGPITFINSPTHTKVGANIKLNNLYQFVSSLEFEEGKQATLLEIKRQEEVLLSLESSLKTTSPQSSSLEARFNLPILLDGKFEASITESVIHVSTNTLLLPHSSAPRRIKAFTDINWDNKQGQVMVLWNADQDPSKKIGMDVIIVPESGRPSEATLHVKILLLEKTYHANMKVVVPYLVHQYGQRNSVTLEVQTPEGQKWMLEVGVKDQGSNSASSDLTFRSISNNNYHMTSDLRWQRLDGPWCFDVKVATTYISPQNRHSNILVVASHHNSPERRVIHFTVEASSPSLEAPLKLIFSTENTDYSYLTRLDSEISGDARILKWELQTLPMGGVKVLDTAINVTAIRDVLNAVSHIVGVQGRPVMATSVFGNESRAYRYHYNQSLPGTHSIQIESPSRLVEAEVTYSPSKAGIKIYLNKHASEAKYEVAGEYIRSTWGGKSRYEGRMSHPMLSRDMKAVVEYTGSTTGHQGSFQLDIFPDTQDKITGSLTSFLRANNTVVIEADLSTRVLQVKPRVMVEVSWAPHTAAFNFTFQETPSSPESLKVYAKYDQISRNYSAVTFHLETEGRPTVDVSGVIEPRLWPHCNGYALLANARTSVLGSFAMNSTVCKPAFLELALSRQHGYKVYKAKVGLQSPYKAEVSLSETDIYEIREKFISLIGIELATPSRVKIGFEHRTDETVALMEFLMEEVSQVTEAFLSWTDRVYREVQRQAQAARIPFPSPKMRELLYEIKNDIMKIYADIVYNDLMYELDAVVEILRGPTATFISNAIYESLENMSRMQKEWGNSILELSEPWRPVMDEIAEAWVEIAHWVHTGEVPELVRSLLEEVRRTAIYELLETHIIEPIMQSYPQQYQATMEVLAKVIDTLRRDVLLIEQKLMSSPSVRSIILKVIDLTEVSTLKQTLEWLASQVTQRILFVAPEPGMYRLGVQIPLSRPIYSLTQLVNMTTQYPPSFTEKVLLTAENLSPIPVSRILETYYNWVPTNMSSTIAPFNRSALVVGDTEVLTFDGVILRMPRSPCKVLLASVPSVPEAPSVLMSHPEPSGEPEINFLVGRTNVTIKPNMDAYVNGRQVRGRQTVGDLVIEVNPQLVTVVSPIMGVQKMKEHVVMVNVSSWLFNHTKGLLGLYDNERANDRLMKDGRNATTLQELVRSWQENPSCSTPPISPIDPWQVSMKESVLCDILFFQMRPCMPVVSPKPFIERCWVHTSPFEAARSYQSFCRLRGISFPLAFF